MHKSILLIIFIVVLSYSCSREDNENSSFNLGEIERRIELELTHNILEVWYPACIDLTYGGYLSEFSPEFEATDHQDKMIVTQSRHMWTNSKAYERYDNPEYLDYARHGFDFLSKKMWDNEFGGFYTLVDQSGNPKNLEEGKNAYGNAFGIYGLSAYFKASGDSVALDLAQKTFYWLEKGSHDPDQLGYFQQLTRQGEAIPRNDSVPSTSVLGYKDQNSSIHLLEAFTELYSVWPDSLLRIRLDEMFHIIRDTIVNEKDYMNLFFTPDWTPISFQDSSREEIMKHIYIDHVSFGHDIETAYLLLEAAEALGMQKEGTLQKTREMVNHVVEYGWDSERRGIYDGAYYFDPSAPPEIVLETKSWWSQAEALNSFLLFDGYFTGQGFDSLFVLQWEYIEDNLVDHTYGEWYTNGLDTDPDAKKSLKGQIWKSSYHNYRALANCLDILYDRH